MLLDGARVCVTNYQLEYWILRNSQFVHNDLVEPSLSDTPLHLEDVGNRRRLDDISQCNLDSSILQFFELHWNMICASIEYQS